MKQLIVLQILFIIVNHILGQQISAKELITKADEKFQGASNISEMTMIVVRPTWQRTVTFKNWVLGRDYSLTLITSPAKDKGQTFLKRENEMWSWNPSISRLIKLPPSMMSQGWMGSDYTNDDILKESSIVHDYDHKITGEEIIEGINCYIIEMVPLENASVVWGKIELWVGKDEYYQMKAKYYDDEGYLVRTMNSFNIKLMDDRKIPTRMELISTEDDGNKTIIEFTSIKFNVDINESFFSQQNMKKVK